MKKLVLLLVIIFFGILSYSQEYDGVYFNPKKDTVKKDINITNNYYYYNDYNELSYSNYIYHPYQLYYPWYFYYSPTYYHPFYVHPRFHYRYSYYPYNHSWNWKYKNKNYYYYGRRSYTTPNRIINHRPTTPKYTPNRIPQPKINLKGGNIKPPQHYSPPNYNRRILPNEYNRRRIDNRTVKYYKDFNDLSKPAPRTTSQHHRYNQPKQTPLRNNNSRYR